MSSCGNADLNKAENKIRSTRGMTLAEILIVVLIILILAGLSFVAIQRYQRSLAQIERDGIAKEIFVAAQNHLTAAKGTGYLGVTNFGTEEEPTGSGIYYYVINHGTPASASDSDVFDLMLPFGSLDATILGGGSYIIRYQKETGMVLDVFYCSLNSSRFNYTLQSGDYSAVLALRDTDENNNKENRKNWKDKGGAVLGWYGGASAAELQSVNLDVPEISIANAEKLFVTVTDTNGGSGALYLIIEGESSGARIEYDLKKPGLSRLSESGGIYTLILDDITAPGLHFAELDSDAGIVQTNRKHFVPGETISVRAVAFSKDTLSNVAYSATKTANSLFADETKDDTAYIGNIRHLENLDKAVSNLEAPISKAVQTSDLNWTDFTAKAGDDIYLTGADIPKTDKAFYPISPDYKLAYDGQSHRISNITANADDAGLFGSISTMDTVTAISNLELIDFNITGANSAGALAGRLTGTTVTNVLARNTASVKIQATGAGGCAGGLVGSAVSGSITNSAASMPVEASGASGVAGGLAGETNCSVTGCYSGGRTAGNGAYSATAYNITAGSGTAGGLIGSYTGSSITCSYSTCSVSGQTCGGLIGSTTSTPTVSACYCTGLVSIADGKDNAFLGEGNLNGASSDNYYYEIINQILTKDDDGNVTEVKYKGPGCDSVSAMDADADTLNGFVGESTSWESAMPFDNALRNYYLGKYNLQTVKQLGAGAVDSENKDFTAVHYGDWPSPELFFVNTPKP